MCVASLPPSQGGIKGECPPMPYASLPPSQGGIEGECPPMPYTSFPPSQGGIKGEFPGPALHTGEIRGGRHLRIKVLSLRELTSSPVGARRAVPSPPASIAPSAILPYASFPPSQGGTKGEFPPMRLLPPKRRGNLRYRQDVPSRTHCEERPTDVQLFGWIFWAGKGDDL